MPIYKSESYGGRYMQLELSQSPDHINNNSPVNYTLSSVGGSNDFYTIAPTKVKIGDVTVYDEPLCSYSTHKFPAAKGSVSGSVVIPHNEDGTKKITVVFSTRVYYSAAVDYGGEWTLSPTDRKAPSVSLSASNITASGVTLKATASTYCDRWDYSLDGGNSWTNFSTTNDTSASVSLTALTPNTYYPIKVRARKEYNQVWGASSEASVKTLGASALNSVEVLTADGETVQLVFSATVYDTSYTHTLAIKDGKKELFSFSGLKLKNGENSLTLTAEQKNALLSHTANMKWFTASYELKTFGGSSQIGNASVKEVRIQTTEQNSAPLFQGFSYEDVNADSVSVTGNNQVFIQGVSKLHISAVPAEARNGAVISSYSVVAGDLSKASALPEFTVGEIGVPDTVPVIVTAVDSRGYTSTASVNITVLPYKRIEIVKFIMRRVNEVETYTEVFLQGEFSPVTVNGEERNSLVSLMCRYKKTSTAVWSEFIDVLSKVKTDINVFEFESEEFLNLDTDCSYNIEFIVRDKLTSDSAALPIGQSTPTASFRPKRLGINNRNPQKALDVIGGAMVDGGDILHTENYLDKIYPVGSLYISVNETSPAELFGGKWEHFGQGRVPVGVDPGQEEFNAPGKTGGEKTHKLTPDEMPRHGNHLYTDPEQRYGAGNYERGYLSTNTMSLYGDTPRGWNHIENEVYPSGRDLGGDGAHNNLQPYITCFMWVRTA